VGALPFIVAMLTSSFCYPVPHRARWY
jgi:hypothetical protein